MTDPIPYPAPAPMALRCPKCAADMVTYERSGVIIDQCRECRGMFLDRGELERLIDAEGRTLAGPAHPGASMAAGGGPMQPGGPMHPAAPPYGVPHPAGGLPHPAGGPPHPSAPPYGAPPYAPYRDDDRYRDDRYRDERYDTRGYRRDRDDDDDDDDDRPWDPRRGSARPSKKRNLLGELLEGFGD